MSNMRLNQFCLPDNVRPIELNWTFAPRLIHRYVTIIRYFIGLIINQTLQSLASNINFFALIFCFVVWKHLKVWSFFTVINKVSYSPCGRKESDMTERLHFHFHFSNKVARVYAKSFELYLTPCDPMDCNPPGSSVHEIPRQE